jgi:hypothetical protein
MGSGWVEMVGVVVMEVDMVRSIGTSCWKSRLRGCEGFQVAGLRDPQAFDEPDSRLYIY